MNKKILMIPTIALTTALTLSSCVTDNEEVFPEDTEERIGNVVQSSPDEVDKTSPEFIQAHGHLEREFHRDSSRELTPKLASEDLQRLEHSEEIIDAVIADFDDVWKDQATFYTYLVVAVASQADITPEELDEADMDAHDLIEDIEEAVTQVLDEEGFTQDQIDYAMENYLDYRTDLEPHVNGNADDYGDVKQE